MEPRGIRVLDFTHMLRTSESFTPGLRTRWDNAKHLMEM